MQDIVIVGAGGFGKEVAWLIERINAVEKKWNILGFLDDNDAVQDCCVLSYKVLGRLDDAIKYEQASFVCAIGSSKIRKKVITRLKSKSKNIKFATLIDPSVIMSNTNRFGEGCIICANCVFTVEIVLGDFVTINVGTIVGHSAILGNFVTLCPSVNMSGDTIIGDCVEIGTGTQVINSMRIGENTIVGAGAVVVKDLPSGCTAVGCPAKPIKFH